MVKCYCCRSPLKPFGEKNGFRLVQCPKCGFITTDPLPTLNEVKAVYSKQYSIVKRNMNYIRERYAEELTNICMRSQPQEVVKVDGMATPVEEKESEKEWYSKVKPKNKYSYLLRSFWTKITNYFINKHES